MKITLLLCICIVLNAGAFAKRGRIVGGQDVNTINAPYQAALVFPATKKFMCGAVLISNKHLLTAAHCLHNGESYYSILRIYIGISSSSETPARKYRIDKVFIHPDYTGEITVSSMSVHDIAVISTKETVKFNEFQKKISLPSSNYRPGEMCTISGWGMKSYPNDKTSTFLQMASVKIITKSKCDEFFDFPIRKDQMCTLQSEGVGVCIGDSGGPVVHNNKLVGIISFNAPCARGIPDVHVNVYEYLNFIEDAIKT